MSQKDKLLKRLFSKPKDFTWKELKKLMETLGYKLIEGSGSRVKFYKESPRSLINLHKPHPGNIIKSYVISNIIETLENSGVKP
ncbi:MAG: type II toxin-antitoxin system HicA family toxin [Desulfobacterium sp.]|jgi:predicted RNA binding protein YcfA (HicA-like mRNA interferase family)|nr:type II toxin-antitoxin system HicA family toxin [Desulfobacterium sp.]